MLRVISCIYSYVACAYMPRGNLDGRRFCSTVFGGRPSESNYRKHRTGTVPYPMWPVVGGGVCARIATKFGRVCGTISEKYENSSPFLCTGVGNRIDTPPLFAYVRFENVGGGDTVRILHARSDEYCIVLLYVYRRQRGRVPTWDGVYYL